MVVIGKWRGSPLEMLKDALIAGGVCSSDSVKVLDKAAVSSIDLSLIAVYMAAFLQWWSVVYGRHIWFIYRYM